MSHDYDVLGGEAGRIINNPGGVPDRSDGSLADALNAPKLTIDRLRRFLRRPDTAAEQVQGRRRVDALPAVRRSQRLAP